MPNFKFRYKIQYTDYIVVEGTDEADAADLLQDYYEQGNLEEDMSDGTPDEDFSIKEHIGEVNEEADLFTEKEDKKADFINCFGINMSKGRK